MYWYNSVKVKVLGVFLIISMVFLISIMITFFFIKEKDLEKNATSASNLATSFILQYIQISQTKAEGIALALTSVGKQEFENNVPIDHLISSILDTDKQNSINIVSGGVWYEPYSINKNVKNHMVFYNRNKQGKFELIDKTLIDDASNYREMEFYEISKKLKSGEVAWTSVYTDPVTHINMITVVSPIYKDSTFIGTSSVDIESGSGINNTEVLNTIEAENMYLMMTDKDGNIIAKSNNLNKMINSKNIYRLGSNKLNNLIAKIRPSLTYDLTLKHGNKNDLLNEIYFIEDDPVLNKKSVVAIYHFQHTHWNIIIGILKSQVMAQSNQTFFRVLTLIILLTLLATIVGYMVLQKLFVRPIESINDQIQNNLQEKGNPYALLSCHDKGEIGLLVENLNNRTTALIASQDREEKEIIRNMKSEKMLLQQSKMAAMGEMMDAVAHQWKQPLNALSMYSEIIKSDFDDGSVDKAYVDQFRDDIQVQIDHMVNTLDAFRTFFRPNKENETFSLLSIVHSALFLTKDELLKNNITVNIEQKDHIDIKGSANEFKHLLLNIINNAKDAFNENDIEMRTVTIRVINENGSQRMEIEDNAGGIPKKILNDIFKANFTSKEESKGTGIGLYMSTQIATKHNATLSVKNVNGGACFILTFNS